MRNGQLFGRVIVTVLSLVVGATALADCGSSPSAKPAVSTTLATTASPTSPVTTATTAPCAARPSSATAGVLTLTVDPGTCLKGGETVTISGTGFAPNSPGGLAECNGAGGEPTVTVEGNQVPVSCTNPLAQVVTTSSDGSLSAQLTIITGISGPPASGTDNAGKQAMKDATEYPCPPTTVQAAAGAHCNVNFGDASGDQVSVPIGFVPNAPSTSTKPGSTLSPSSQLGGL